MVDFLVFMGCLGGYLLAGEVTGAILRMSGFTLGNFEQPFPGPEPDKLDGAVLILGWPIFLVMAMFQYIRRAS